MEELVLDTSIIVKWFVLEQDSKEASVLLQNFREGKIKIVTSVLAVLELTNTLLQSAKLSGENLQTALDYFYGLDLELVPIDQNLIKKTASFAAQFKITSYDALFLVLAEERKIPLITADRKHHLKDYSPLVRYLN